MIKSGLQMGIDRSGVNVIDRDVTEIQVVADNDNEICIVAMENLQFFLVLNSYDLARTLKTNFFWSW